MKPEGKVLTIDQWIARDPWMRRADMARALNKTHAGMTKILKRNEAGVDYRVEVMPDGGKLWIKRESPWVEV